MYNQDAVNCRKFLDILYVIEHNIHRMGIHPLSTPQASVDGSQVSRSSSPERLDSGERSEHTLVQNHSIYFRNIAKNNQLIVSEHGWPWQEPSLCSFVALAS
jgi:hypothetical protein